MLRQRSPSIYVLASTLTKPSCQCSLHAVFILILFFGGGEGGGGGGGGGGCTVVPLLWHCTICVLRLAGRTVSPLRVFVLLKMYP